jgi:hypothetical protein
MNTHTTDYIRLAFDYIRLALAYPHLYSIDEQGYTYIGTDQNSRLRLICRPMLALRPVMLSNAPQTRGQLCLHAQPLSVSRSWIA